MAAGVSRVHPEVVGEYEYEGSARAPMSSYTYSYS